MAILPCADPPIGRGVLACIFKLSNMGTSVSKCFFQDCEAGTQKRTIQPDNHIVQARAEPCIVLVSNLAVR